MPAKKTTTSKKKSEAPSKWIGKTLPRFKVEGTSGQTWSSDSFKGKFTVLYFYPKDMTSGCTVEARDFQKALPQFHKLKAQVFGVSRDPVKSHDKFREKESLEFDLLSDTEEKLCQSLDVIKEKSLYGRKYMGVDRSTFLVSPEGKILREWRGVKVPGHVDEVLAALKEEAKKDT